MNNITEEVAGGRLWAGSAHDINAALGHARKLGFIVEILDAHDQAPANSSRGDVAAALKRAWLRWPPTPLRAAAA